MSWTPDFIPRNKITSIGIGKEMDKQNLSELLRVRCGQSGDFPDSYCTVYEFPNGLQVIENNGDPVWATESEFHEFISEWDKKNI